MTRIEKVTATVVPAPVNFIVEGLWQDVHNRAAGVDCVDLSHRAGLPHSAVPFLQLVARIDVCLTYLHNKYVFFQGWGGHGGQVRLALPMLCALAAFSRIASAKTCQVPAQIIGSQSLWLLVPVTSTMSGVSPKMTG